MLLCIRGLRSRARAFCTHQCVRTWNIVCECVIMILAMSMSRTGWVKCIVAVVVVAVAVVDASEQHNRITRAFAEVYVCSNKRKRIMRGVFCPVPVVLSFLCKATARYVRASVHSEPVKFQSTKRAVRFAYTRIHTSYAFAQDMQVKYSACADRGTGGRGRGGGQTRDANMQYRIAGW